ncbi:MAG: glycoside hydrolase family 28 protein, partial [Alistipes sp.]|nr:glycoside hydrolase family 28 protein [Alistipes sp.]
MKRLLILVAALLSLAACTTPTSTPTLDREAMRDAILARITGATIPTQELRLTDFEVVADGITDAKPAFDRAIARAKELGGARLVIPAGEYYLCGPIHLIDNLCLDLEAGAVLRFSPEPS